MHNFPTYRFLVYVYQQSLIDVMSPELMHLLGKGSPEILLDCVPAGTEIRTGKFYGIPGVTLPPALVNTIFDTVVMEVALHPTVTIEPFSFLGKGIGAVVDNFSEATVVTITGQSIAEVYKAYQKIRRGWDDEGSIEPSKRY